MSIKNQNILISPPLFLEENNLEQIISKGHTCSYCRGKGWMIESNGRDCKKVKCKVCNGTGKLDAEITIKWKASSRQ